MKPLEEPLLRRVPDRIAGAERPEPDVESHRRSDRSDLLERELGDEATLEPPKRRVIDAGTPGHRPQAQARPDATATDLLGHDGAVASHAAAPTIRRSLSGPHDAMLTSGPSLALICGSCFTRTHKRRPSDGERPHRRGLVHHDPRTASLGR